MSHLPFRLLFPEFRQASRSIFKEPFFQHPERFESLIRKQNFESSEGNFTVEGTSKPFLNVKEDEHSYLIEAELPGAK